MTLPASRSVFGTTTIRRVSFRLRNTTLNGAQNTVKRRLEFQNLVKSSTKRFQHSAVPPKPKPKQACVFRQMPALKRSLIPRVQLLAPTRHCMLLILAGHNPGVAQECCRTLPPIRGGNGTTTSAIANYFGTPDFNYVHQG